MRKRLQTCHQELEALYVEMRDLESEVYFTEPTKDLVRIAADSAVSALGALDTNLMHAEDHERRAERWNG
jgi:hypothetical protein